MSIGQLTGPILDHLVALAEGWNNEVIHHASRDWSLAGPIIEREGFGIVKFYEPKDGPIPEGSEWCALLRDDSLKAYGSTPLIAAMRLYVIYKFGGDL